jgi:preprotein translocase subunit SecB
MNSNEQQPKVGIVRIYVKDISFESPNTPQVFMRQINPEVSLRVDVHHKAVEGPIHEVVLAMTLEAKQEGNVAFIVEIEQAGLFEVRDATDSQCDGILNVFCATTLFPYARQTIDSLLGQGGLPPLMMAPFNFESLYRQKKLKIQDS